MRWNHKVLLVNESYYAISYITLEQAISLLIREGKATIIDIPDYQHYCWNDWEKLDPKPEEYSIIGVSKRYRIPKVIKLKTYNKLPHQCGKRDKFSNKAVYQRDNYSCMYCGDKCTSITISIDHVIPRCKGGKNDYENCVTACKSCNAKKGSKSIEASGMKLIRTPQRPDKIFEIYRDKWIELIDISI